MRAMEEPGTGWPKAMAYAALATFLASSGQLAAGSGKIPGLIEAQTGLRTFAVVALTRVLWDLLHRWRGSPAVERCPKKLQVELQASAEELNMAKSELEATALKMAHTEARLQRSEQLRQQLHGSFANVLGRLENSERKESQLHQEILRIVTTATDGSTPPGPSTGVEGFTFAPSTPASSQDVEEEEASDCEDEEEEVREDENEVDPGAAEVDLSESATVSGHAPAPTPAPRSRDDSKEAEMEEHEEPVAKRPRLSTSRRSLGSECGVRLVIHR